MGQTKTMSKHTPGPWAWEKARHVDDYVTAHPRSLVSLSERQRRHTDGKDLGLKPVLIPVAAIPREALQFVDAIALEIHGTPSDEALIAAAPPLLAALVALLKLTEAYEEQIDGEWGSCRAIKQIEDDGDLPDEIVQARVAIAEAEPK